MNFTLPTLSAETMTKQLLAMKDYMAQLHFHDEYHWILTMYTVSVSFPERLPRTNISIVGPFKTEETALSLFQTELLPNLANKMKDYYTA